LHDCAHHDIQSIAVLDKSNANTSLQAGSYMAPLVDPNAMVGAHGYEWGFSLAAD
jgi:hypothetical protein